MEKISTRKQLIELLKDTRAVEIAAREGYRQDVVTFKNFEIVDTIKTIKMDEDKHIAILDKLIKLLE